MMSCFTLNEFFTPCSSGERVEVLGSANCLANLASFTYILNTIRSVYDYPIYINSWYRNAEHNKRVGGVSNSYHLKGAAVDLGFYLKHKAELIDTITELAKKDGLPIGYVEVHENYIHMELARPFGYDWKNYKPFKIVFK